MYMSTNLKAYIHTHIVICVITYIYRYIKCLEI